MTPERTRLLAEKARIEAELAKLDTPDRLLIEAREIVADWWERNPGKFPGTKYTPENYRQGDRDGDPEVVQALAALRRGMELAAAPLMPVTAMTNAEIEELADKCITEREAEHGPRQLVLLTIRATIARLGPVRKDWPSEDELREMAAACSNDEYEEKACMKMARRLKDARHD